MAKELIKLEVGAGGKPTEGFTHLDVRPLPHIEIVSSFEKIPLEDNSVSCLYSSHSIEHVSFRKLKDIFAEWYRVIAPGGEVHILTPSLQCYVTRYNIKEWSTEDMIRHLYGEQDYPENFHLCLFDYPLLEKYVVAAGFKNPRQVTNTWEIAIKANK